MQKVIRILLLAVIVLLGFMIAFPQWSDFLVAERSKRIEQRQMEEMGKPPTAPKDWHIKLAGNISKDTNYKITVTYRARKKKRSCQHYNPFSSSYLQDVEFKSYSPTIENNKHSISIPLTEFNPKKGCQFEVEDVALEVFSANEKSASNSNPLFVNEHVGNSISSYTMNIECAEYYGRYRTRGSVGCYQNIEKSIPIKQRLSLYNESWTININRLDTMEYSKKVDQHYQKTIASRELEQLCKLMRSFDETNNINPAVSTVPVNDEIGNQVLLGEFGEHQFTNQSRSAEAYRSRLKAIYRDLRKSLTLNSKNQFVDPWARPYIYQRSEDNKGYSLYSKGADESNPEDDIQSICKG